MPRLLSVGRAVRARSRAAGRWRWGWWACWAAIVAFGVGLKAWEPPEYIFNSPSDDQLFVQMAAGFLHGHWSSSWAQTGWYTLAKPVGFPMFLAAAHVLPWSPLLTVYLMFVLGSCLVALAWWRTSGSRAQTTIILAALVLSPVIFANQNQRIYRDSFIEATATFVIGLAFAGATFVPWEGGRRRRVLRWASALVLFVLLGLGVGLVAISKPTWYWAAVAVAAPFVYPVARTLRRSAHRLRAALLVVVAVLVTTGSTYGVLAATRFMNQRKYGVALVEDFSSGGLARTWKAWASVEAGPPQRDVPITPAMRTAVYAVSPTARLLEPFLETPRDPYRRFWCALQPPGPCDSSGKYEEWDLQLAAVDAGQVNSAVQFQQFFDELADQIESACADGRLHCTSSPVLATGLPPLSFIPLGTVASRTVRGTWDLLLAHYAFGYVSGGVPTKSLYTLWTSTVRGIPPLQSLAGQRGPPVLYPLLRIVDDGYMAGNLALLGILVLGSVTLILRRRRARAPDLRAAGASAFFLVSTLLGMGTLAVFDAAQSPTYINPMYWSDFASCAELFLLFGAFAAWRVLAGGRRRVTAGVPAAAGDPPPPPPPDRAPDDESQLIGAQQAGR